MLASISERKTERLQRNNKNTVMPNQKVLRRDKVRRRIRKNIFGTPESPRMSVFRSNKQIYVQIIDDVNQKTLVSAGSLGVSEAQNVAKKDQAQVVGKQIAEKAIAAGVQKIVFDRGGYLYHGRVKALGDAAREAGLKF
ncbi:MAG: large subunit ribosomal protein L18 [Flavobacteriales bacterium]|jgi:large subunit ribosomal protein L18